MSTGKTQMLLDTCQMEMRGDRQPSEIIFCSFTKSAASEARNRAMQAFGGGRSDYPWFATEHSICFRLLGLKKEQVFGRRHLKEFGKRYRYEFSGEDVGPNSTRYEEAMLQTIADHYEFCVNYMENKRLPFEDAYYDFVTTNPVPEDFTKVGFSDYFERRLNYKAENRLWSFTDMITATIQQGLFPGDAKVLILDEAQDCSPLLWDLIRLWSTKVESYYIAGDPLQTLYFWSGSDPELFFSFPGEEQTLTETHRFGPAIRDYAEKVVAPTGLPLPRYEAAKNKGSTVARKSFASVDWQGVGDAFLLIRTRWLISQVVDQFVAEGIPFVSERGRQSPLATTKGRAYHTLLRLAEGCSATDTELKNLVKHTGLPYLERGAKTRVRKLEEGAYQKWQLKEMGFTERFMDALYGGFGEVLCQNTEDWEKAYLGRVYRKYGIEVFEREPGLKVTTIHGSKGRQASQVFLCPDYTNTIWDSYLRGGQLSERLLMYVGVTRAMDKLTVLLPIRDHSFPFPRINNGGER